MTRTASSGMGFPFDWVTNRPCNIPPFRSSLITHDLVSDGTNPSAGLQGVGRAAAVAIIPPGLL